MTDPRITDEAANHGPAVRAIASEFMARYRGTTEPDEFALSAAQAGLLSALPHLAPQAMPTREQIAAAMHDHQMVSHGWRQGCREDVCIGIFLDRADAVLALLNGAES